MTRINATDEWTPLDDLLILHTAEDADELRRRLLCFPDQGGNKADAFEPWCLFHKVHADEPEGAVVTAMLLITDRRWSHASGRLARRIEDSGLVPDEELDLLAQTFLAGGAQLYWEGPGDWFGGPAIVLSTENRHPVVDIAHENPDEHDDGPIVFARQIRPPVRRWAGARAVRADPSCWGELVQRARQLDSRGGAAIVHGLLDSIDLLAPAARETVLLVAEGWPHHKLREAAATLRNPPQPAPDRAHGATSMREAPAAQPPLF